MIVNLLGISVVEETEDALAADSIGFGRPGCERIPFIGDRDEHPAPIERIRSTFDGLAALEAVDQLRHGAGRADDLFCKQGGSDPSFGRSLEKSQDRVFGEREPVFAEAVALERFQEEARASQGGEDAEDAHVGPIFGFSWDSSAGHAGVGPGGGGHRWVPVVRMRRLTVQPPVGGSRACSPL